MPGSGSAGPWGGNMTVELAGAAWVLPLAFVLQAVSAALIFIRLVKGPSDADRVVAVDALTLVGAAAVALVALTTAQAVVLDVAVVLALATFLGTAAFALLFGAAPVRHRREPGPKVKWRRVERAGQVPRSPSRMRGATGPGRLPPGAGS